MNPTEPLQFVRDMSGGSQVYRDATGAQWIKLPDGSFELDQPVKTALTEREILYGDVGYTGDVPSEGISRFAEPDYYRAKIREFQVHLNTLAATADALRELRQRVSDPALASDIDAWLDDFESNRNALLLAAEAVNAAAQSANAVGLRMPVLQVPSQLAALPPLAIAAIAGAVAGTAWAVSYAIDRVAAARALITRKETLALLPEEERAAALAADQKIELAQRNAQSVIGNVADIVKWIALGVGIWFAYKAVREFME